MGLIVYGDNHAEWGTFNNNTRYKDDEFIILGDVGLGFNGYKDPPTLPDNIKFFRGNHDSPEVCKSYPNCLGDYGIIKDKIGFFAGGYSLDYMNRTPGLSWWYDEELSMVEMENAYTLFEEAQPEIMLSHEAPAFIVKGMYPNSYIPTRTSQFLESIAINIKSIKYWYFGHYHRSYYKEFMGIQYYGIDEHEMMEVYDV